MTLRVENTLTPEEYLAMEEKSENRHEYLAGRVYAMAGATLNHNRIVGNAFSALREALRGKPCEAFSSDLRVSVRDRRFYVYPDVLVICGKIELEPRREDTVRNPTLIVEVLSRSTKEFDAHDYLELYRAIPSMQEYVMIDQRRVYIEHYRKQGRFWVLETLTDLNEALIFESIGVTISLAAIYEQVEF